MRLHRWCTLCSHCWPYSSLGSFGKIHPWRKSTPLHKCFKHSSAQKCQLCNSLGKCSKPQQLHQSSSRQMIKHRFPQSGHWQFQRFPSSSSSKMTSLAINKEPDLFCSLDHPWDQISRSYVKGRLYDPRPWSIRSQFLPSGQRSSTCRLFLWYLRLWDLERRWLWRSSSSCWPPWCWSWAAQISFHGWKASRRYSSWE